jgi:hypothetical protein
MFEFKYKHLVGLEPTFYCFEGKRFTISAKDVDNKGCSIANRFTNKETRTLTMKTS